jgi:hypothetical protein
MIISEPVQMLACPLRAVGALPPVAVATHRSAAGSYRPPELNTLEVVRPPQTIISVPVQTAVWLSRGSGVKAPVLVARHVFVLGL